MPGRRPQAVADVMEASALRGGRMSLNVGLGAATLSAASIGCGASVGREGPIVHLGASLCAYIARRLHLSASLAQTLLGCGVAAAIAGAFNAPIAGVFFAIEVVIGHYGLGAFSPVVISSAPSSPGSTSARMRPSSCHRRW
jgi:chloride channel protein, CIC family